VIGKSTTKASYRPRSYTIATESQKVSFPTTRAASYTQLTHLPNLGQYAQVKKEELLQIHAAYKKLAKGKDCKLTAVVVAKRHNVRFYPHRNSEKGAYKQNCKPGTLVDQIVTSPYFNDFYLQSHKGLQGTARHAHYFVLENTIGWPEKTIQSLVSHNTPPVTSVLFKSFC
jgi:hypothetical protein